MSGFCITASRRTLAACALLLGAATQGQAHAEVVFNYTGQSRLLMAFAQVDPPSGPTHSISDMKQSELFAPYDDAVELHSLAPATNPQGTADILIAQQSEALAQTVTVSMQMVTSLVTPPTYATMSNGSDFFSVNFALSHATTVRLSGTVDGGPSNESPSFAGAAVQIINTNSAQVYFHEATQDGELGEYEELVLLPAGNYKFFVECHIGLSNFAGQMPQLEDAGSLLVDLTLAIIVPEDLNSDGAVDGGDLGILLAAWGTADTNADLNHDGTVDGADLGLLLGAWTS